LGWRIEFHPDAARELGRLDRATAGRILRTLETRIATLDDPRTLGAALRGEHSGYWRYRIGDYRVVASIQDERITILIVRVGHRREVYR
jgi:mRNA interferase RelE/StbE